MPRADFYRRIFTLPKCRIGDQKIDVLFGMPNDERPIIREAKKGMVRV
jgi:hypothetical protein